MTTEDDITISANAIFLAAKEVECGYISTKQHCCCMFCSRRTSANLTLLIQFCVVILHCMLLHLSHHIVCICVVILLSHFGEEA